MQYYIFLIIITLLVIAICSAIYVFELISVNTGYALMILLLIITLIVRGNLKK